MDIFFLQVLLLLIPGIIWERIDNRCGVNRPDTQFDILRRAFCFGLSAYAGLFVLAAIGNLLTHLIHLGQPFQLHMVVLKKDDYTLGSSDVGEVAAASGLAVVMSILWLYITNNKLPIRLMQYVNATRRFGDEDVWDFTFNSRRAEVEYVHVRDFDNKLVYSGWVEVFSETGGTRELVLRNVVVASLEDPSQSYETPRLYLARPVDNLTIEFPYVAQEPEDKPNEQESATDSEVKPDRSES